jgi:hypothetical protein
MEEKSFVNMSEFPTGVWILEVCWKWSLVNGDVMVYVTNDAALFP